MGLLRDKHFHTHNNTTVAAAYPQTIHEHRAPTDESVKILREMEEAARQSVLSTHRFNDNELKGIAVQFLMNPADFDSKLYIRFSLNGKEFQFTEILDRCNFAINREKAVSALMKAVREAIFDEMVPRIGEALMQHVQDTGQ
jgi:hypothetical protein